MRYRTRLWVTFLAVTLVKNGISLLALERLSLHYLHDGYRAMLLSMTTTAASMLEPGLFRASETEALRAALRKARDAEEHAQVAGRPGEIYRANRPVGDISGAALDEEFVEDEFGVFLRLRIRPGGLIGAVMVEAS